MQICFFGPSTQLCEAAKVVEYFDTSGMLDVEGPGFKTLVVDAVARIDGDPVATDARIGVAGQSLDAREALTMIRHVLDQLLDGSLDRDTTH